MQTQKYRDFTLVFGAPSGGLFDMLSGVSDKTGSPFSEVFFEYLKQFFEANDNPNVIEETLSAMLDADIRVGDLHMDYQYWLEEKPELSKFNQNQNSENENDKLTIKGKQMNEIRVKHIKIPGLHDHRISQSAAVLGLLTGLKVEIKNFETVRTSAPSFLNIVKKLGGSFEKKNK